MIYRILILIYSIVYILCSVYIICTCNINSTCMRDCPHWLTNDRQQHESVTHTIFGLLCSSCCSMWGPGQSPYYPLATSHLPWKSHAHMQYWGTALIGWPATYHESVTHTIFGCPMCSMLSYGTQGNCPTTHLPHPTCGPGRTCLIPPCHRTRSFIFS